ncbi:MAG: hypothetical protein IJ730_03165 [Alphaproteobacteria bacterium]|nr:hypothetical protein [Alphaproteobacteria bacterium]
MKRLVYSIACMVNFVLLTDAMDSGISYHSALQEQKKRIDVLRPRCGAIMEQKLQNMFVENTKKILQGGAINKREAADPLIDECKEIFFGTENKEDIQMYGEYESEKEDIQEAVKWIVDVCCGLPDAALRLQALYENIGDYDRSLFWALVACDLGYKSGTEAVGRLMSLIENRS